MGKVNEYYCEIRVTDTRNIEALCEAYFEERWRIKLMIAGQGDKIIVYFERNVWA